MGAKVPENKSFRERKFPRTVVPGRNFRFREQEFQGVNGSGIDLAREQKGHGAN